MFPILGSAPATITLIQTETETESYTTVIPTTLESTETVQRTQTRTITVGGTTGMFNWWTPRFATKQ